MGMSMSSERELTFESKMTPEVKEEPVEEPIKRLQRNSHSSISTLASTGVSSNASFSSTDSLSAAKIGLDSFTLVKVLGKGSHGKVILVRKNDTQQLYAMKEMNKTKVIERGQLEQTLNELETHVRLWKSEQQSPYIVPLRWAFHTESRLYLVFDFCPGGELYFHLGQRGKVPEALARFYAAEVALALEHLHSMGIVYHDLKPENLVLSEDGHIHLVDFGLCKTQRMIREKPLDMCGTTEYLAPEMFAPISSRQLSSALDWWAFGMVLYEMLTGLPPWYSYDQKKVVSGILRGELTFPNYLSDSAKSLIECLLVKDPSKRLGSGGSEEVLSHPFFELVNFDSYRKKIQAVPFVPPISENVESLCNFDKSFTNMPVDPEVDPIVPSSRADKHFKSFYFNSELQQRPCRRLLVDEMHCEEVLDF